MLGLSSMLVTASCAACATVDPQPDFDRARKEIASTTGEEAVWDPSRAVLSDGEIRATLAGGLTSSEATRLALLNNRRLQAGFLGLGVARADYVQAGLLDNPNSSLAFLFPDPGSRVRWTADLFGNIAKLWQIPAQQALAEAGLEQRLLDLSRFAGELVAETRSAYFECVAARASSAIERANLDLAQRALEGVRRQVQEGLASSADESLARSSFLEAELERRRAEGVEARVMRKLAALLSIDDDLLVVEFADALPAPSAPEFEREALVARSSTVRPDLLAAQRAVATAELGLALERRRTFARVDAGVSFERPEGESTSNGFIGPGVAFELPLFDQNQVQVRRAEFELAERHKELEALLAEAAQDVRAALDGAQNAARTAAFARDELLVEAERSSTLAQRAYELGDATVLTLLAAQRSVLAARRAVIGATLTAAQSRIALERAVGAPLTAP
jgi:outer membrane protein TolC